jgi:hypothetical protein
VSSKKIPFSNKTFLAVSEGSLLLKMTRQKGTISIFIAEIE